MEGAEFDLDNGTVTALGRKFGQVTVQGNRQPIVENLPEIIAVDPQQIIAERKILNERSVVPDWLANRTVTYAMTSFPSLPNEEASQELIEAARRGRPSKEDKIGEAIDILLKRGVDLAKLPRPKAMAEIRKCAANELKSDINIGFSDPVLQRVLFRRFGPRG